MHTGIPGYPPGIPEFTPEFRETPPEFPCMLTPPGILGKKPGSWEKTRNEPRFSGGGSPEKTRVLVLSMMYAYACKKKLKKNAKLPHVR